MSISAEKFRLALMSHQTGDFTSAEQGYRNILSRTPQDVTVLYHLGIVLHQQGKMEEALLILNNTVRYAPDFPQAHFSLGSVLSELHRGQEAETAFRNALALEPKMQKALLRLGEQLVPQKKYTEAVSLLRQAIQLCGTDKKAWIALTGALRGLDLYEEAVKANIQLLALDGSDNNYHVELSHLIYMLHQQNPELACQYLHQWIVAFPDNALAQHVSSSILRLPAPDRASDHYVKALFDNFAGSFEKQLSKLGYRISDMLAMISALHTPQGTLIVLDAGCGTGLAAESLRPYAKWLTGVDLSPKMLEKSREKELYDELVEMELGGFLQAHTNRFDLITAFDVFIYFGDLTPVLNNVFYALQPGGKLTFSVESSNSDHEFTLETHGRYSHNKNYVISVILMSGLRLLEIQEKVLRYEFGNAINALLVVADKPN